MTNDRLTEQVIKHNREISALTESAKSAHKRIDEIDRITESIYKLATNIESLTMQVKMLTERMDTTIERIEAGQKSQGERIGKLEREPADKWKDLVKQVIGLIVAASVGAVIARFIS